MGRDHGEDYSDSQVDDQFRALMEGLRTTIPGVMVLLAFLLTVPFSSGYAELAAADRTVYYVSFLSAALAAVLLIAPSVHQRVRAPITGIRRLHFDHVLFGARLAIVGTFLFALSVTAVVYLVTSVVFSTLAAIAAGMVLAGIAGWSWFFVPLVTFARTTRGSSGGGDSPLD